jgi:hypothetical protein
LHDGVMNKIYGVEWIWVFNSKIDTKIVKKKGIYFWIAKYWEMRLERYHILSRGSFWQWF